MKSVVDRKFVPFVLVVFFISSSTGAELESGEELGKTLVSYPKLVEILKAKNSSRPLGLFPGTAQQLSNLQAMGFGSGVNPQAVLAPSFFPPGFPSQQQQQPSKNKSPCSPASLEKSNGHIAKLCAGYRKGDVEEAEVPTSKCLERYCVTIIPEADDEDIAESFGEEIVAYTDCSSVGNLFKILTKSELTPKCYDCSR